MRLRCGTLHRHATVVRLTGEPAEHWAAAHHEPSLWHSDVPSSQRSEYHCLVTRGGLPPIVVMLYGPRDDDELAICKTIVEEAYLAAGGRTSDQSGRTLGLGAD